MKPTHTNKSNYLPDGVADTEGQISQLLAGKTPSPEANLRAYKSAAMIGLAISLGASGILLPRQGDEAIAAEPLSISPATTTQGTGLSLSSDNNQSISQPTTVQGFNAQGLDTQGLKVNTEAVEPSSPVVIAPIQAPVYHQVQSGDNFWQLAQKYQISADAIAQANNLDAKATLTVGQSLRIPTTNAIHEMQLGEITEANSPIYGVSRRNFKIHLSQVLLFKQIFPQIFKGQLIQNQFFKLDKTMHSGISGGKEINSEKPWVAGGLKETAGQTLLTKIT